MRFKQSLILLTVGQICILFMQLPLDCFGQDKKKETPTCGKTTKRVLEPFITRVLNAQIALGQYEQKLALKRIGHEDKIQLYQDAIHGLAKKRNDETVVRNRQIELANGALKKLGLLGLERTKVEGLSHRHDEKGWELFIAEQKAKNAKRMAEYAKGIVGMHFRTLGGTFNLNRLREAIAKEQKLIAACDKREPGFHLTPLGYTLDGAGIDKHLAAERKVLQKVKADITAGTFSLHVPAYGYHANRNKVLEDIKKAEKARDEVQQSWRKKKYSNHNKMISYTVSNGKIEEMIAIEKARKKGEETVVHVPSLTYSISGTGIRKKITDAKAAGNQKTAKYWREKYPDWKTAYETYVKSVDKAIERLKKALELHRKVYEEDLKKRQAHIDGKLKTALAQTPCGSAMILKPDPKIEQIEAHRRRLSRHGSNQSENEETVERYNDRIYVDSSNRVHGDLGDAWSDATGIPRKGKRTHNPADSTTDSPAKRFMDLKGHIDYIVANWDRANASKEMVQLLAARKKVDDFLKLIEKMGESGADIHKIRKALKSKLNSEIAGLVKNGILSPRRIDGLLNAIEKTRAGTTKARKLKSRLEALKQVTSPTRWEKFKSFFKEIPGRYQPAIGQAVTEVSKQAKGMSAFDKGMLGLSMMNAVADSFERIDNGVPVPEAVARAAANFAVERVIDHVPYLTMIDAAGKAIFISYAHYSGEEAWATANLEDVSKMAVQLAADQVASAGRWTGEQSIILESSLTDRPTFEALLNNVSTEKLRRSLRQVETQLDIIPPGHREEARLLRIRASFRRLLRAKSQQKK